MSHPHLAQVDVLFGHHGPQCSLSLVKHTAPYVAWGGHREINYNRVADWTSWKKCHFWSPAQSVSDRKCIPQDRKMQMMFWLKGFMRCWNMKTSHGQGTIRVVLLTFQIQPLIIWCQTPLVSLNPSFSINGEKNRLWQLQIDSAQSDYHILYVLTNAGDRFFSLMYCEKRLNTLESVHDKTNSLVVADSRVLLHTWILAGLVFQSNWWRSVRTWRLFTVFESGIHVFVFSFFLRSNCSVPDL